MRQLTLNLVERSYNIYIDNGLLRNNKRLNNYCLGDNVLIISNKIVGPLYLDLIKSSLISKNIHIIEFDDGESQKNIDNYLKALDYLINNNFRRNDTLVSLGGGVAGDLGGFVAASYQRGMGFIQVPTSLLAQVDSSVGGKTAINHSAGKNLIGAFYQPKAVFIDLDCLDSLPEREYISGLAEIAKYGMLGESNVESLLLTKAKKILNRDKDVLEELIYYSCAKKAQIVSDDEKEDGNRALLNLGHTFGHAIEKVTEYKEYLHGEAVSIGIHIAINLSLLKKIISVERANQYHTMFNALGLPSHSNSSLKINDIIASMKLDKKNINETYRLVLPTEKECIIVEETDIELLKKAIVEQIC